MAKIKVNPILIKEIRGEVGGLIYYPDPFGSGEMICQEKGERKAPPSVAQLAHDELFKLAVAYGNRVKLDPILRAEYAPFCRGRMTPYQAGLRDYLRPPVIQGINLEWFKGKPGQIIRIVATDDTRVTGVWAVIRSVAQVLIEEGPAALSLIANTWVYAGQTEIPPGTSIVVEATAVDRPGNEVRARVHYYVE